MSKIRLLAMLLVCPVASVAVGDELQNKIWSHVIVMDHLGDPKRPEIQSVGKTVTIRLADFRPKSNGVMPYWGNYDDYVENIRKEIVRSGKAVLFFVHGGMNVNSQAASRAATILRDNSIKEYYPIFICWDSPFYGDWEQALWVRAGKTERYGRGLAYSILTTPFQLLSDVGRAATRLPLVLCTSAYSDLYSIRPSGFTEHQVMESEYAAYHGSSDPPIPSPQRIATQKGSDRRSTTQKIERNISLVATIPLKVATHPVIDAIGVGAWNNMLRRTDTMFERVPHYHTKDAPLPSQMLNGKPTGALAIFMDTLQGPSGIGKKTKVTLVGHSMGAIICNRIVAQYQGLNYDRIVYMAAACRVSDFEQAVIPYLQKHPDTCFYNLSLHPVCEAGEMFQLGNFPFDVVPRGSLLVWIDNIFGNPPSEQRRMLGIYQTAVLASHNVPLAQRKQVFYKAFDAVPQNQMTRPNSDLVIEPQRHGDFSRSPFWEPKFWSVDARSAASMPN
ncbi:MAG: hypothetical protein C5B47_04695 [Verrucomicrobia bacterium]|nr:MAG: hypothetical protein C5B47_04695 [Verrucomicrobiota bacterium]